MLMEQKIFWYKEEAMLEIKLEDEIISEINKKNSELINTNLTSKVLKNEKKII